MALTREDLQSLLQWLDEDPQFRAELRRRLLAEPLIVEIRLPTDWMTRVDERLERLESDVGTLKSDVGTLKSDVGTLKGDVGILKSDMDTVKRDVETLKRDMGIVKGKVLEVDYRTKAASIFGIFLRNGRDASEFVSTKLDEAEAKGLVTPQESEFVMAADLLWMGNIRRGKFEGETLVLVGESSWKIEADDVERAVEKAKILRKVGIWAIPFVGGAEWASPEVKEQALKQKVLCATDAKLEPSRSDPDEWERFLESWRP
jgi:hypothetical protein